MLQLRSGQALIVGQKIRVYKNLHKGLFSIQDYKSKKVIGYGDCFMLKDVTFKVSQAGRRRVLMSRVKNVHAFVEGNYLGTVNEVPESVVKVYYNPYLTEGFVNAVNLCLLKNSDTCFFYRGDCYTN